MRQWEKRCYRVVPSVHIVCGNSSDDATEQCNRVLKIDDCSAITCGKTQNLTQQYVQLPGQRQPTLHLTKIGHSTYSSHFKSAAPNPDSLQRGA